MTQFAFLQAEWSEVLAAASRAEACTHPDPRTALRRTMSGLRPCNLNIDTKVIVAGSYAVPVTPFEDGQL
jgi:hypothetical protein